jgi:hypothetical protein
MARQDTEATLAKCGSMHAAVLHAEGLNSAHDLEPASANASNTARQPALCSLLRTRLITMHDFQGPCLHVCLCALPPPPPCRPGRP